jgi:mRNA-degrading endonuclease RelE of RelBE toxin-antitoxin system
MMYEIRLYRKVHEYLNKIPIEESEFILDKINELREKPYSHPKLVPLKGYKKLWKFYIKEHRAIIVLAIGNRRDVYGKFFERK